jgi:uncharacterized protein (TIGR03067 family)
MRAFVLFLIGLASGHLSIRDGCAQEAKDKSPDFKALQGVWRGWVVEGKGKRIDEGFVNVELTIKGDTIVAKSLGGMKDGPLGEGTYQLSVAGDKKIMDGTRTVNPSKGKSYLGICELEGDTLRWCVANPGLDRPTEMLSRKGQFLMVLKRQ